MTSMVMACQYTQSTQTLYSLFYLRYMINTDPEKLSAVITKTFAQEYKDDTVL